MQTRIKGIDNGKSFDWDNAAAAYAKFRDIYPPVFYKKIAAKGLCVRGQSVLDVGTGTGVLPRNMYRFGAKWTGADSSERQIEEARRLTRDAGMDIAYILSPAEDLSLPPRSFDVITACQCLAYFQPERAANKFAELLKENGKLLVLYMAWLPREDAIAGASEALTLRYNPDWSGAGETVRPIALPTAFLDRFELLSHEECRLSVPFTRESWHGRMLSCRGVSASLTGEKLRAWEEEHRTLLRRIAPERFQIAHYAAMAELRAK